MRAQLADGNSRIGELATPFSIAADASKHVRVLENARACNARDPAARTQLCRLQAARLAKPDAWLRLITFLERKSSTPGDGVEMACCSTIRFNINAQTGLSTDWLIYFGGPARVRKQPIPGAVRRHTNRS